MRPQCVVSTTALAIVLAIRFLSESADGAEPRGRLDPGMVAATERDQQCVLSPGEVAVLGWAGGAAASEEANRKGVLGRVVVDDDRFVIVEVGEGATQVDLDDPSIAPVFRSGVGPDAPFLFPNGEIIVQLKLRATEEQAASWGAAFGLTLVRPLGIAKAFLFKAASPSRSLEVAARAAASEKVVFCVPNWVRQRSLRQQDPLYPYQWHLKNIGEVEGTVAGHDINVESVWATHKGCPGQVICIVDDGLEIRHKDLAANVVAGLSWDFVDADPDPTAGDHGTSCAGVAAARGYNDIGVRGVAPRVGLCGHRIGSKGASDAVEAEAETRACDQITIYNNSWGPKDDGQRLEGPRELLTAAMTQAVTACRGGKGAIYTWAGGNGLGSGDNSNYDGYASWRYTIAVGATTSAGTQSSYSEVGANLCVNAPSSGGGDRGISTTDRTGPEGFNKTGWEQGNFADLDFTNQFGGTSSACPTVAGACALILQVNPGLGWRDVKKILMTTAWQNDPTDADWSTNAAGYHVNHKYGFGRLDVAAAVIAAAAWTNLAPEVSARAAASPGRPIPLGGQGVSSTVTLASSILIESVEVYFSADHGNWGDLNVVLTAPSGTSSVLAEKHDTSESRSGYAGWRFGSERHLGELAAGDWTLTVRDLGTKGGGTFTAWTLVVYGTDPDAHAVSMTTVAAPTGWGSVSPTGTSRLYEGVAAGITAIAAADRFFTEWTASPEGNVTFGFGGTRSPETTVTLSGDATLTATFSESAPEMATVGLAVFPVSGGFTDPGEQVTVNVGAGLAITAVPTTGYGFAAWTAEPPANAQLASATSMSTLARIKGDVTLTARFRAPSINLTQGSAIRVSATDLGIPGFTTAPRVTGTVGRRTYPMKVTGELPSSTVTAEWAAKPRIYKLADYMNPADGLGAWLEVEPVASVSLQTLVVDATRAGGATLDLADVTACKLVPPVIESVGGERAYGSLLTLMGRHFGTKPPRVSIEYRKSGRYFTKTCMLVQKCPYRDTSGQPSCMEPLTGDSEMTVMFPMLPPGAQWTGYLILENPIGMCSFYLLPREP